MKPKATKKGFIFNIKTQTKWQRKKSKKQITLDAIGKGAREVYLEQNPHGYSQTHKVHKSKKSYNRQKNKKSFDDCSLCVIS